MSWWWVTLLLCSKCSAPKQSFLALFYLLSIFSSCITECLLWTVICFNTCISFLISNRCTSKVQQGHRASYTRNYKHLQLWRKRCSDCLTLVMSNKITPKDTSLTISYYIFCIIYELLANMLWAQDIVGTEKTLIINIKIFKQSSQKLSVWLLGGWILKCP